MKNDTLSKIKYATLVFFLINSFFINVGYQVLLNESKLDTIIDIIIGGIAISLTLYLVLLTKKNYNKNIIDIINKKSILKYPILLLIILILSITAIYTLINLVSFIHYYVLKGVNTFTISITLVLVILLLVSKNLNTISKVSEIFFYIYILVLLLGFIGLSKYINISNLKPLLTSSLNNNITSIFTFFSYSIIPIFLTLFLDFEKTTNKSIIVFNLISILTIFFQSILIISVLGLNLSTLYLYPDIMIYKKISFLNILERVEIFFSFNQLLNGLFLVITCIYIIKKILKLFFNKKKESTIMTLIGLILFLLINTIIVNKDIYLGINIISLIIILYLFIKSSIYKYNLQIQDHF